MPKSFYKGEPLGQYPPCALCGGKGQGKRAELHLPCGVSVWLCGAHRSDDFQRSRAGRDLVVSLSYVWQAAGCYTATRARALRIHRRRLLAAPPTRRRRPGSYSWAALRQEAEAAFAAGEDPRRVIERLRKRADAGEARAPTTRTMRRWFREGRWLEGGDTTPDTTRPPVSRGPRALLR